jgi:hypothetical protein
VRTAAFFRKLRREEVIVGIQLEKENGRVVLIGEAI